MSVITARCLIVIYQIVALSLHLVFGQCLLKLSRMRLRSSLFVLVPFFVYTVMILALGFLWHNPFKSLHHISLVFAHVSLAGSIAVATLMTVLLEQFKRKVKKIQNLNLLLFIFYKI